MINSIMCGVSCSTHYYTEDHHGSIKFNNKKYIINIISEITIHITSYINKYWANYKKCYMFVAIHNLSGLVEIYLILWTYVLKYVTGNIPWATRLRY